MLQQDSDILSTCFSSLIVELESKELWALFLALARPSHPPHPAVAVQRRGVQPKLLTEGLSRRRGRCPLHCRSRESGYLAWDRHRSFWVGGPGGIDVPLAPVGLEQHCRARLVHHCCLPACALWRCSVELCSPASGLKVSLTQMASQVAPEDPPSTPHSVLWIFFQTQKRYFQREEEFLNYPHSADAFH